MVEANEWASLKSLRRLEWLDLSKREDKNQETMVKMKVYIGPKISVLDPPFNGPQFV